MRNHAELLQETQSEFELPNYGPHKLFQMAFQLQTEDLSLATVTKLFTLNDNQEQPLLELPGSRQSPIMFCSNQTETTFQSQTETPRKRLEGSDEAHDRGVLSGRLANFILTFEA